MFKIVKYETLKEISDQSEKDNNYYSGLIIKKLWLSKIFLLTNPKDWEIRGSRTNKRGKIFLLESGSGLIVGETELVNCIELDLVDFLKNEHHHKIPMTVHNNCLPYPKTFAWVFRNTQKYSHPIPYVHPQGAVIWVNIPRKLLVPAEFPNT